MFIWFMVVLYFLVIDFFIFKQNWFAVILSLAIGFIIFLFYILIKLIVGPKTQEDTTQSPPQSQPVQPQATLPETAPQPQQTITQPISQPTPVIKKDTVLTKPEPKPISLPFVFFIIEIIILIGLTLYLILG